MTLKGLVKNKARHAMHLLPMGRDLYLSLARERLGISYRGVFSSHGEASAAVSPKRRDYDVINAGKAEKKEEEKSSLDNWFHDHDYPLLFWLSRILDQRSRVLELGGSVGHFFYSMQRYYPCAPGVSWTIAELPEAVKLGQSLAADRGESRLQFIESDTISGAESAEIFLTAGTLQYMKDGLADILTSLAALPSHVLVHNLPAHADREFWTLQNLGLCEVPYRIYAVSGLTSALRKLGYERVAAWKNPRDLEIPFHRNLVIDGYLGFYFRKI